MTTRHPAKQAKPPRKPVDGEDGFTDRVYRDRLKVWTERDCPIAERKDRE
jgi:hypothetical protein